MPPSRLRTVTELVHSHPNRLQRKPMTRARRTMGSTLPVSLRSPSRRGAGALCCGPMFKPTPALLLLSLFTSAIAWSATPDETKCKAGKAQSCAIAGRARIDSEEYALAKPLLEKGCKLNFAEACDDLGWIYDDGLGEDVDKVKAEQFYGKACAGNFARGCTNQGVMYLGTDGIEKDPKKASALFTKACDGKSWTGCKNLGLRYLTGDGVAKDEARAKKLFEEGCNNDHGPSCYDLAVMYQNGEGIPKNKAKAKEMFSRSCELKYDKACQYAK